MHISNHTPRGYETMKVYILKTLEYETETMKPDQQTTKPLTPRHP
jgi:hypothetical protein